MAKNQERQIRFQRLKFKDFLVGSKLKRDKLSIVKRNAMMCTIVKITGRYQATKQIGLRRQTLKSLGCVDAVYQRRQSEMGEQSAEAFYEKNAVHLPGHRTVNKRLKKQKMVLTKPVGCLFDQFVLQHPDAKMSRWTFFSRRPAHIMPSESWAFRQCLCDTCVNPMLKMSKLKQMTRAAHQDG